MRAVFMGGRRAQGSVEYLGTYAWAFLGLLVTIGALSYFGVFEPTSYMPERCDSGSQISCEDSYISISGDKADTGVLFLEFKNNYNREVTVTSVAVTSPDAVETSLNHQVMPGLTIDVPVTLSGDFQAGRKVAVEYEMRYQRYDSVYTTPEHTISGSALIEVRNEDPLNDPYLHCGNGIIDTNLYEECDPGSPDTSDVVCSPPRNKCNDDCHCIQIGEDIGPGPIGPGPIGVN